MSWEGVSLSKEPPRARANKHCTLFIQPHGGWEVQSFHGIFPPSFLSFKSERTCLIPGIQEFLAGRALGFGFA